MRSFFILLRDRLLKKASSTITRLIPDHCHSRVVWWISRLCRLHRTEFHALNYQPESGCRSTKAERLVEYCLGNYLNQPNVSCSGDFCYFQKHRLVRLKTDHDGKTLSAFFPRHYVDQKKVSEAMISQRTRIPGNLDCWLVRGDSAGRDTRPEHGLHLAGMRPASHRYLVLVPTSNRDRFLGPNLGRQMQELKGHWIPWEKKTDTAWWGGALTGDRWSALEPRSLTRREVLYHFRDHPSEQVFLSLTELPDDEELPNGLSLSPHFTKKSAFRHKCLVLLPGNDIASGSSWYFAGNSVVLMPKPHLEHILYFEMNPWEHYVPLENDASDILVKLNWVLDHPSKARKIVEQAHKRLHWLSGPEYLWACGEVLRRIASNNRSTSSSSRSRNDEAER